MKKLPNDNSKMVTLAGSDMTDWKNTYYPQLVQNGKIRDGAFSQNPLKDLRYGIGNDGVGTKLEYLQFLWSAYKFILCDFSASGKTLTCVKDCIKMLEPYAVDFANQGTNVKISRTLKDADMRKWKDEYYPKLSNSGMVPAAKVRGIGYHVKCGLPLKGASNGDHTLLRTAPCSGAVFCAVLLAYRTAPHLEGL